MRTYPQAYVEYLAAFHADRDYFECHEIMEEHWKKEPDSRYRNVWLGLIQLAVGQYHERRSNRAGAFKMYDSAFDHLEHENLLELGIDKEGLLAAIRACRARVEHPQAELFEDLTIPLQDEELLHACRNAVKAGGKPWLSQSDMSDADLVDKHKRRDRSEVIRERERQRLLREQARKAGERGHEHE